LKQKEGLSKKVKEKSLLNQLQYYVEQQAQGNMNKPQYQMLFLIMVFHKSTKLFGLRCGELTVIIVFISKVNTSLLMILPVKYVK
jgi:hypothetical protein